MSSLFKSKALLLCGTIACPLFLSVVLILGAIEPNYSALRYPLSSLSIGVHGWIQISNFILTGLLLLLFSQGLKQSHKANNDKFKGPLLIRFVSIGLIGAGIFVTDPVYGFPQEQVLVLRQFTFHGHLHDLFSMLVFICLPWACFTYKKYLLTDGHKQFANYSAFSAYAMILTFVITSMGFKQIPGFVNYAGLFQRLCIIFGWTWITFLSWHLIKVKRNHA